jgi:uracil-DNA glycosylase
VFSLFDRSWCTRINSEFSKSYFRNLFNFINSERKSKIIYPSNELIFSCFNFTSFDDVKVVILGQDPYCGGQAHGLAFSVVNGYKIPGSLFNIYKELYYDLGINPSKSGNLIKWAKQGVLLLNTVLTVEHGLPGSHFNIGWEFFTNFVISLLSTSGNRIIFVLWGKSAFEKVDLIDSSRNMIIVSSHPSSNSAQKGFFGSRPFSKINFELRNLNKKEIDWRLN